MNKPAICLKGALPGVGLLAVGAAQAVTVTDIDFSEAPLLTSDPLIQVYSGALDGASLIGVQPTFHTI